MINPKEKYRKGRQGMPPDLIQAATVGDIESAKIALAEDPDCIAQVNQRGMNALQVAMVNFHTEFASFLLEETAISTMWKDHLRRDSLDIALMCSNNAVGDTVWERWNQEYVDAVGKEDKVVANLTPKL